MQPLPAAPRSRDMTAPSPTLELAPELDFESFVASKSTASKEEASS